MSKILVLDSYALLAYLQDEAGANEVEDIFVKAQKGNLNVLMSVVNWGEVYYNTCRTKGPEIAAKTIRAIDQLPINIIDADRMVTFTAAQFKAEHSIAYADCFAAALAKINDCEVITGDAEFTQLQGKIKIKWIDKNP